MYCWKCGKELSQGSKYCSYCGQEQQTKTTQTSRDKHQHKIASVTSSQGKRKHRTSRKSIGSTVILVAGAVFVVSLVGGAGTIYLKNNIMVNKAEQESSDELSKNDEDIKNILSDSTDATVEPLSGPESTDTYASSVETTSEPVTASEDINAPIKENFERLVQNYLTDAVTAINSKNPNILVNSQYIDTTGDVYSGDIDFINANMGLMKKELISCGIEMPQKVNDNEYNVETRQVHRIYQLKDYDEVKIGEGNQYNQIRNCLSRYSSSELEGKRIYVDKTLDQNVTYKVIRTSDGRWKISEYAASIETSSLNVNDAYATTDYQL